jgi:hypothetical protein
MPTKIDPTKQVGNYTNQSTPATPPAGQVALYAKTGKMTQKDEFGVDISLISGEMSTINIAASNATAKDKANADFVCTGANDDTIINAALTTLKNAQGGTVKLSAGGFSTSASIIVEGDDTLDQSKTLKLLGSGISSTIITPSNNTTAVLLQKVPTCEIGEFSLVLSGNADGVKAVAGTNVANDRRGFWRSRIHNIYCSASSHTGWILNLENPFRSFITQIQSGYGIANGIWLKSGSSINFNPGNLTVEQCQMGLDVANGTGYKIERLATGGVNNIMTFIECDSIDANSSSTSSIGWHFIASTADYRNVRDVKVSHCNPESFNTCFRLQRASNINIYANFCSTKQNGTIISFDSQSERNRFTATSIFVPDNQTTTVVNDANINEMRYNKIFDSNIDAGNGATVNLVKTNTTRLIDCQRNTWSNAVFPVEWNGSYPLKITTAQRDTIITPYLGYTIYNTTVNKLNMWDGVYWNAIQSF